MIPAFTELFLKELGLASNARAVGLTVTLLIPNMGVRVSHMNPGETRTMSKPQHQSWQAFEPCELVKKALGSDLLYPQRRNFTIKGMFVCIQLL